MSVHHFKFLIMFPYPGPMSIEWVMMKIGEDEFIQQTIRGVYGEQRSFVPATFK